MTAPVPFRPNFRIEIAVQYGNTAAAQNERARVLLRNHFDDRPDTTAVLIQGTARNGVERTWTFVKYDEVSHEIVLGEEYRDFVKDYPNDLKIDFEPFDPDGIALNELLDFVEAAIAGMCQ